MNRGAGLLSERLRREAFSVSESPSVGRLPERKKPLPLDLEDIDDDEDEHENTFEQDVRVQSKHSTGRGKN